MACKVDILHGFIIKLSTIIKTNINHHDQISPNIHWTQGNKTQKLIISINSKSQFPFHFRAQTWRGCKSRASRYNHFPIIAHEYHDNNMESSQISMCVPLLSPARRSGVGTVNSGSTMHAWWKFAKWHRDWLWFIMHVVVYWLGALLKAY